MTSERLADDEPATTEGAACPNDLPVGARRSHQGALLPKLGALKRSPALPGQDAKVRRTSASQRTPAFDLVALAAQPIVDLSETDARCGR